MYIQCTLIFCPLRQFIFLCVFPHFKIIILIVKKIYVLGFIKIKQIFSLQCVFSILIASTAVLAFCLYSPRKKQNNKKIIKTSAKKQYKI